MIKTSSQEAKEVKALIKVLKRFNPILISQGTAGCLVSKIMLGYTKHANPAMDKRLFEVSAPIWVGKGLNEYSITDEFIIVSKDVANPGTLFSVKRSAQEIKGGARASNGMSLQCRGLIYRTLKETTPATTATVLALGGILELLTSFCHHLVHFKIDNGLHLTFREHSRTKSCVEVYIGGCFNTDSII